MSAHIKKHHTSKKANIVWHGAHYSVPLNVLEKYKIHNKHNTKTESIEDVFDDLISEYGEPAVLLKGLRIKEGMSQVEFAEALDIFQQNLSAMENGRRNIGKEMAKRIAEKFGVDYQLFL